MAGFIIIIVIIIICISLFGKADTKRTVLQGIGLDLSEKSYNVQKENEFEKYCKKAMKVAISDYNANGKNELDFLNNLDNIFFLKLNGYQISQQDYYDATPNYNLQVKSQYIKFAKTVVNRRIKDLKGNNVSQLLERCNFMSKQDLRMYVDKLWRKYQYPWPEDWMKEDSFLS